MHEYGIALEIARLARESAGDRTIRLINLRVGELSGVSADSVALYLELIFREKNQEPPQVAAAPVPASFLCACGNRYSPVKPFDPCPACSGFDRKIMDGRDCTIESIEVDDG
jgi:hydrogenase nickel incorporation protein HypA/HybF